MAITAKDVKNLRDKTGAGMLDCKKALTAADGNIEEALENLRKSGIAKAEKKASRATKDGNFFIKVEGNKGVIVEGLCETDFVATNAQFLGFGDNVTTKALASDANGDISDAVQADNKDELTALIAKIGENMQLRRGIKWESEGQIDSYIHGKRIAVLIDVEGEADAELLHNICMHIAAFNPQYITPDEIPAEDIAKEKEIAKAQLTGKPENIIEKILEGKINKWYSECCLTRQPWIIDDKTNLSKLAPKAVIKRFARWEIGEEL